MAYAAEIMYSSWIIIEIHLSFRYLRNCVSNDRYNNKWVFINIIYYFATTYGRSTSKSQSVADLKLGRIARELPHMCRIQISHNISVVLRPGHPAIIIVLYYYCSCSRHPNNASAVVTATAVYRENYSILLTVVVYYTGCNR